MKKLLFIAALVVLGVNAFAKAPQKDDDVTVNVKVKAELIDESFTITDIDGNPLLLDFKQSSPINYSVGEPWTAYVEYKIRANENVTADTTFDIKLAETGEKTTVTLKHENTTKADVLVADLRLDNTRKIMKDKQSEVIGRIDGSIDDDLTSCAIGEYHGTTTLTATVL